MVQTGSWIRLRVIATSIFLLIAIIPVLRSSSIEYSSPELFPLPKELEPAVAFWVQIYTRYYTNDYVFHDARNLSVIYEVVRFGSREEGGFDLPQSRAQKRALQKKKNHYKLILQRLASKRTNFAKLTGEEKRVFELFGRVKDRKVYRIAARNIRIQKGQRDRFLKGLKLSGRYLKYIREIFLSHGLPGELAMLPHVESSFNYRAYSSAGAAGLWQFTRRTGRRFLKISYEIDERLDPILASEAAARLLRENYQELGTWPLAITAYNHGTAGLKRARKKLHTSDIAKIIAKYRSRYFKFASRNFYCEFLAALHIAQNYQQYFGAIQFDPPVRFREFQLPHYVKLATIAAYFQLEEEELQKYNPALRPPILKGNKYIPRKYRLRIPEYVGEPEQYYARIPAAELFLAQKRSLWYRVRRGDTLARIARRNRTSVSTLLALNDIRNANRIRVGEVLRLPGQIQLKRLGSRTETLAAQSVSSEAPSKIGLGGEELSGPVLDSTTPPVKADPNTEKETRTPLLDLSLPASSEVLPSPTEIEMVRNSNPPIGYIRVEPEETLGHYAEWMQVATQTIRNWNHLEYGESIQLGQKLKLVFRKVSPEEFNMNRLEFHRGIEEDFFDNYQILGTFTHKVKKGENIWYLCNYVYNLPYWLIKSHNPDVNLDHLKPGDLILIPEISEVTSNL